MRALALITALWGQVLWAETDGRALYEGRAAISVRIGDAVLPAVGISCAGCHGHDGAGGREAGAGPPLLGLEPQAVLRALRDGVGADGRALSSAMPRFVFSASEDAVSLTGYIARIGMLQREGLGARQVALSFGEGATAERFAQAFFARVEQIAPYGIFGRRLVHREDGAFVVLAATRPSGPASAPHLFPLYMLWGDEDTRRVRGGFASFGTQIAVLADAGGTGVILDPEGRTSSVPEGWSVADRAPGGVSVIALGPAAGQVDPRVNPVLIAADDMGHFGRFPGCVTVADPRPAPHETGSSPLERYGHAAAEVLVAAMGRCGRDCTRARLFESFDDLAIKVTGWPQLDYAAQPLTGTKEVALRRVCFGDDGALRQ